MNGNTIEPAKPTTLSNVSVYPPARKIGMKHNGVSASSTATLHNGKRKRISEDNEFMAELIKSQIFAYGKKPEIKLTLFPEMYSCSNCCELFYTEMGLREHQLREVFNAHLSCPHCSLRKVFANRCQLLNHLKSHGVSPTPESLKGMITFGGLPEVKDFLDYSIIIPTRHPGYTPTAPTTVIPSQLDVAKTELQKTGIFLRGERQYKIIPVLNNGQKNVSSAAGASSVGVGVASCSLTQSNPSVQKSNTTTSAYFCSACDGEFSGSTSFMDHIKKANLKSSELNVCAIDSIPSRSNCEQTLHSRLFHDKVPPFLCPECGDEFEDYEELSIHDDSECFHLKKAVIYSCNFKEGRKNSQDGAPINTKWMCGRFATSNLLFKHLEQHWRDIHKCNFCPQALLSAELLQKHVAAFHTVPPSESNQRGLNFVQCLVCQVIFFTRALFQEHFQSKLKEHCLTTVGFHCEKCAQIFDNSKGFASHSCKDGFAENLFTGSSRISKPSSAATIINKARPSSIRSSSSSTGHKCVYCKKPFPTTRILKRHQPSCDLKLTVQRKPEFCKLCSKTLQGSRSFLAHGVTHLNAGFNICLFCNNQQLEDFEDLDTHLDASHVKSIKSYPHLCIFCDESLPNKEETHAHFSAHHEKATNRFKCATCGEHFDSVPDLTNHKTAAHSAPTPSKTPVVNGTTNSSRSRIVRTAFSYSYKCKFCNDRKFQTRPGLRKHLRNHHPDIDFTVLDFNEMRRITRNTVATTAEPRRSKRDRRLSSHRTAPPTIIGTHSHSASDSKDPLTEEVTTPNARTPDGKVKCLKCSETTETFTTDSDFYDHVRNVHVWQDDEDENGVSPEEIDGSSPTPPVAKDKSFWCPECSLEFVAKPSFRMHLQFAHTYIKNVNDYMDNVGYGKKEKPVKENQCSVCRLKLETKEDYERHIRTHGMAFLKQRLQRSST